MKEQEFKFSPLQIKNIKIITYISAAIILLIVGAIYYKISLDEKDLLENGIRQEVVVVHKYKSGKSGKYSTVSYYMKVDRFEEIEQKSRYKAKDTTGMNKSEKEWKKIFSHVFGKKRSQIKRLNQAIKLNYIEPRTYNNVRHGEIVTLVYFKGKEREGRLLREIQ